MIAIRAGVRNDGQRHEVSLETNGHAHALDVSPKAAGRGSSVNGGELLFLALATCYCNDVYREAARRGIVIKSVRVDVTGTFGDEPGSCADAISYDAAVEGEASEADLLALLRRTDEVAEIQNTLRRGTPVILARVTATDAT
jgi:uncharacterized OsmC-like protein